MNLWVCFLASGLWHGAAWHFVVWGIYNGGLLVIERVFLLRVLVRVPRLCANAFTFLLILAGWTIFRAPSLHQAVLMFGDMVQPGRLGHDDGIWLTPLMMTAAGAAALISFLPRVPFYASVSATVMAVPSGRFLLNAAMAVLFVFALAKGLADPFKPFLYFRF